MPFWLAGQIFHYKCSINLFYFRCGVYFPWKWGICLCLHKKSEWIRTEGRHQNFLGTRDNNNMPKFQMAKWPISQMANLANGQLAKWPISQLAKRSIGQMPNGQSAKRQIGLTAKSTKANWANGQSAKWPNGLSAKWQIGQELKGPSA